MALWGLGGLKCTVGVSVGKLPLFMVVFQQSVAKSIRFDASL